MKWSSMAASASVASIPALPAERFFRTSLFLLMLTAIATLVSTGKLDLVTMIVAPSAVLYKGIRWWRRCPAEIPQRVATRLVVAYLLIFPIDVVFLSRSFVAASSNPALYAALLGAVHFLLFVMLIRLYSANTDRDALFLTMLSFAAILASAVLTIDTTFLGLFFLFLLFGVATFVGLEMRRGSKGAIAPEVDAHPKQERRLDRALVLAALSVALGAMIIGGALFFFFPRFSAGYLGRTSLQPTLMSGFSDDVELGQIGEIKKNSAVVMRVRTGKPVGYPALRWRGIALSAFDGKRWSSPDRDSVTIPAGMNGVINLTERPPEPDPTTTALRYTILLQPVATDTVFAPANAISIRGNLSGEGSNEEMGARRSYIIRDATGSLFNPFHNFTTLRYEGFSLLPARNVPRLRAASTDYPEEIRNAYLQLPNLDPRIPELAKQITARALTPFDKTVTLENYLRSHYAYNLNLTGKPGDDPLAHFLFETHSGHCVRNGYHAAHAGDSHAGSERLFTGRVQRPRRRLHRARQRRAQLGGSLFSRHGLDDFRSHAAGSGRGRRFLLASRPVHGLVRAFLERVGDQLRFHSPNLAGANHAAEHALVDGDYARLVRAPTGKRAAVDEDVERRTALAAPSRRRAVLAGAAVRLGCRRGAAVVALVAASFAGTGALESAACIAALRRTLVLACAARLRAPAYADAV
jgi:hypothetical protein